MKKALASGHVCLSPGVDPVRASFELLFEHPGVASAIVGTINPLHLAHNVATVAKVLRKKTDAALRGLKEGADMPRTLIRKNPSNFKTLPLFVEATPEGLTYQSVGMPLNFAQTLQRRRPVAVADTERFFPWSWQTWAFPCA
nr:hypothetical protein GCM10020185_24920 [Pseudomonas brassicacearum subsp. brassicacearum]